MKRSLWLAVLIVVLPGLCLGQEAPKRKSAWGYVFGAPGAVVTTGGEGAAMLHLGGGVEGLVGKGFGIGAEVGYLSPMKEFSEGIGVFSVNGAYHFRSSSRGKVMPFVTGGYSLAFREGVGSGANVGAGIQYWMNDRVGLRFEFRDHFNVSGADVHLMGLRIGLAFR